jgi:dTDP-4-amino-4,6-dideoxygalactose transaminase
MMEPFIPLFKVRMAPEAAAAVADVLASGYIGQGAKCEEFERRFGEYLGTHPLQYAPLLLNSCTSAIDLALHLIGVGPGDEVITTPITCTATNSPPALRGARLVWADVDPLTGNIDPTDALQKVTDKTKAIIAVNWGGRSCDQERLGGYGIPVIEDAAHGPYGGNDGDYVCYSFQAIKHLTTGDGGALITHAEEYHRAKLLRWYGLDRESGADFRCAQNIREIGGKSQSNDIAAAIGLANLPGLEWSVAQSRLNAAYYHHAFKNTPGITLPPFDAGASYWIYTILVEERDQFVAHLKERGIAASQVHRRNDSHDAFRAISTGWPLPGADHFDAHQVSIPNGWWLSPEQREYVANVVLDWATKRARRGVAA